MDLCDFLKLVLMKTPHHLLQLTIIMAIFGWVATPEFAFGQASITDFERVRALGNEVFFTGIDLSPDGKTLAVSTKKPLQIVKLDAETKQVIGTIDAGSAFTGSKVQFSSNGKYLLVKQMNLYDFAENKKRKLDFEILDAQSGQRIHFFEKVQDVTISANEQQAISLEGDEVVFWQLPDGSKIRSFKVEHSNDAIAMSPDGNQIAIAQTVNKEDIKGDSRFRKQKKAAKLTVKYKQQLSIYNSETGKKIATINEFYDIIHALRYSAGGEVLLVFQKPHLKVQTGFQSRSYINLIDVETNAPMRKAFTTQSAGFSELRFSSDGSLAATNSRGTRFEEIHLYDVASGTLLQRFEMGHRLFEKDTQGEKLIKDSRPSFVFLPGNKALLIVMGNQMIQWNFETN